MTRSGSPPSPPPPTPLPAAGPAGPATGWLSAAGVALAAVGAAGVLAVGAAALAASPGVAGVRGVAVAAGALLTLGLGGSVRLAVPTRAVAVEVTSPALTLTLVVLAVVVAGSARRLHAPRVRTGPDGPALAFAGQTALAVGLLGGLVALVTRTTVGGLGEVGEDTLRVTADVGRTAVVAAGLALVAALGTALSVRPGLWQRLTRRRVGPAPRSVRATVAGALAVVVLAQLPAVTYALVSALQADGIRRDAVAAVLVDAPATGVLGLGPSWAISLRDGERALRTLALAAPVAGAPAAAGAVAGSTPGSAPSGGSATQSAEDAAQVEFDRTGSLGPGDLADRSAGWLALPVLGLLSLLVLAGVRTGAGGGAGRLEVLVSGVVLGVVVWLAVLVATVRVTITGPVIYGGSLEVRPSLLPAVAAGAAVGAAAALLAGTPPVRWAGARLVRPRPAARPVPPAAGARPTPRRRRPPG